MRKTRIAIIGHFGGKNSFLDGQTIKTKILYEELNKINKFKIKKVDTYYKSHNVFKLLIDFLVAVFSCKHLIILVAENGMRTFFPILYWCSKLLNKRIYHCVIGASLAQRVVTYKNFKKYLNSFTVNWCETIGLVKKLHNLGVTNAELLYNSKRLTPISPSELIEFSEKPYKICTFSRVMKEKGIEDIVHAVRFLNERNNEIIFELDIYGQVESGQEEWFCKLKEKFPNYIKYCGIIPYDQSVAILKKYFALIFPTRYLTEGVPGTIIDAYASGLPVIASKWENFDNIIDENTGFGYEFGNVDDLINVLEQIAKKPDEINQKKIFCLKKYTDFSPDAMTAKILKKFFNA